MGDASAKVASSRTGRETIGTTRTTKKSTLTAMSVKITVAGG
ncbi:hypothetical protein ABZX83_07730 [Streptomyces thermoviolaceus]